MASKVFCGCTQEEYGRVHRNGEEFGISREEDDLVVARAPMRTCWWSFLVCCPVLLPCLHFWQVERWHIDTSANVTLEVSAKIPNKQWNRPQHIPPCVEQIIRWNKTSVLPLGILQSAEVKREDLKHGARGGKTLARFHRRLISSLTQISPSPRRDLGRSHVLLLRVESTDHPIMTSANADVVRELYEYAEAINIHAGLRRARLS
jgi:hypothetical protein